MVIFAGLPSPPPAPARFWPKNKIRCGSEIPDPSDAVRALRERFGGLLEDGADRDLVLLLSETGAATALYVDEEPDALTAPLNERIALLRIGLDAAIAVDDCVNRRILSAVLSSVSHKAIFRY
jgi:hypothetical protein